jgi:large subunit ribosomal protein L23
MLAESKTSPQYVFRVAKDANKIAIRNAIESMYSVKVASVNTITMKGKTRRQGRFVGKRADWKKAFIILKEGQTIDLFS